MIQDKRNVISFINMKGGVGKTTLCKEIAIYLSEKKGRKILIIDIDPQSNCTQSLFERHKVLEKNNLLTKDKEIPSVERIFTKSKGNLKMAEKNEIICELTDMLHLIPGDLDTVFMEREVGNGQAEQRLYNYIKTSNLSEDYDYIFIDCPPTYSFYTISAALSSHFYLVPVKPDAYSLLGLDLLERVMRDLQDSYLANFESKPIKNLGVVFTMVSGSSGINKNMYQIKKAFKEKSIYFFENTFDRKEKVGTSSLAKSITDRSDSKLLSSLELICNEFERRINDVSKSDNKK